MDGAAIYEDDDIAGAVAALGTLTILFLVAEGRSELDDSADLPVNLHELGRPRDIDNLAAAQLNIFVPLVDVRPGIHNGD